MIEFELAQKLREAGYPQKLGRCSHMDVTGRIHSKPGYRTAHIPLLHELIEECGDDFVQLIRFSSTQWSVTPSSKKKGDSFIELEARFTGKSPWECFAKLYIAIKKANPP